MNFYPFNIGDYAGATRHLTWDEDMAYRRLLDAYYSRELPLPADKRQVYRLVGAQSKPQREAVDAVLDEFFTHGDGGFRNARCEEEIGKANIKKQKAKDSAAMRWKNHPQSESNANADANAERTDMRTHNEGNAPNPNPNPNPNIRGEVVARARPLDADADLERQLREAAGWQNEPSPSLAITGPIVALIENGADLELDVLPTIRALAHKADGRSWNYFVRAIARQRDTRINAATILNEPRTNGHDRTHPTPRKSATDTILDLVRSGDGEGAPDVR